MTSKISRRHFLALTGATAAASMFSGFPVFAQAEKVLRIGSNNWPAHLDFANQAGPSNVGRRFSSLMYDALLIFDRQGALVPQLATKWVNDGLEWRFTLREGVEFHDGTTMTADDVVYSLRRLLDPAGDQQGVGSYGTSLTRYIADVAKTGDLEIVITTTQPDPLMLFRMATHFAPIVPQAATEALGDAGMQTAPIAAGPYKVVEYGADRMVLEKHEGYWGGVPAADQVIVRLIPEDATRVGALQAGEIDVALNLPVDQIETIDGAADLGVKSIPLFNYMSVLMNTVNGPLTDVNVRRAMSLSIDRQAIVDQLWGGRSRAMDDYLLPNVPGYDAAAGNVRFDLEEARAALAASSYSGEEIVFNPVANYYSNSELPTQVIAQMWTDLGLNVTYSPMDLQSYFQGYLAGQLTCNIQSFDVYGDGMFLYQNFMANAPIPLYRPNYFVPSAEFDSIVEGVQTKFSLDERAADMRQLNRYFAENVPTAPIYQTVEIVGVRDGINLEADPLFQINLRPDSFSM